MGWTEHLQEASVAQSERENKHSDAAIYTFHCYAAVSWHGGQARGEGETEEIGKSGPTSIRIKANLQSAAVLYLVDNNIHPEHTRKAGKNQQRHDEINV
jgi:hypothetical protein